MILQEEPLHAPSLRALANIDARARRRATAGGASSSCWRWPAPSATTSGGGCRTTAPQAERGRRRRLARRGRPHAARAPGGAGARRRVRGAVGRHAPAERAPGLDSVGVGANERVSPVAKTELARAYADVRAHARQPQDGDVPEARSGVHRAWRWWRSRRRRSWSGPSSPTGARWPTCASCSGARWRSRGRSTSWPRRCRRRSSRACSRPSCAPSIRATRGAQRPTSERRGGDVEARAAVQGRQAARRAVPRSGEHRVLVAPLAARGAEDGQPRRPAGVGRHHRRGARARRRGRHATASRIWRASPPATTTWPCGRSWTARSVDGKVRVRCIWDASSAPSSPSGSTKGSRARSCSSSSRSTTTASATRDPEVAVDTVRAGHGDLVYLVGSREAALALRAVVRAGRRGHRRHRRRRPHGGGAAEEMKLCRVEGSVVATVHHPVYDGQKLLIVHARRRRRLVPRRRPRAGRRGRHGAGEPGGQRHAPAPEAGRSRCRSARSSSASSTRCIAMSERGVRARGRRLRAAAARARLGGEPRRQRLGARRSAGAIWPRRRRRRRRRCAPTGSSSSTTPASRSAGAASRSPRSGCT